MGAKRASREGTTDGGIQRDDNGVAHSFRLVNCRGRGRGIPRPGRRLQDKHQGDTTKRESRSHCWTQVQGRMDRGAEETLGAETEGDPQTRRRMGENRRSTRLPRVRTPRLLHHGASRRRCRCWLDRGHSQRSLASTSPVPRSRASLSRLWRPLSGRSPGPTPHRQGRHPGPPSRTGLPLSHLPAGLFPPCAPLSDSITTATAPPSCS